MTQTNLLTLISFLCLYLKLALSQTNVPSTINEKENLFFRSGTFDLTVSVSPTDTNITINVTYSFTLLTAYYQLMTSITSIDQGIDPSSLTVSYNITIIQRNITMFKARLYSVVLPRISYAKLSYLCVDNAIRSLQFYVLDVYFGDRKPGLLPGNSINNEFIFNFTTRIRQSLIVRDSNYIVQSFIKGFKIINQQAQAFSIDLITTVVNASHFKIDVKSQVMSTQYVTDLYAQVMAYNSSLVQYHVTKLTHLNIIFNSMNKTRNDFGSHLINKTNFYLGVKGFRFSDPTNSYYYDFFFDFPINKVQLNGHYQALQFISTTVLSIELRQCTDPVHPYFMNWTYKCYSSCPTLRRYQDEIRKQCAYCMFDCYTCQNGLNCSTCNRTHYFRQNDLKDDGTLRCKPISGYYDAKFRTQAAKKCDATCVQCILQATNCSVCKTNQYLLRVEFDGTCNDCPRNCTTCIDNTLCTSCDRFYGLDSTSLCVPVCTQNCSLCHIVSTPVEKSVCDQCKYGFYQNLIQVSECYGICGDGIVISGYQDCEDNNTQNGDGCNSQCKTELGYKCYSDPNNMSKAQQCYYQQDVRFSLRKLRKYPKRNTFRFQLLLSTLNPSVLKQLDWAKIISIDIDYITFGIIERDETYTDSYNSTIRTLVLTFEVDYKPTIKSIINIQIDPKRNSQPSNVTKVNSQLKHANSQLIRVSSIILNPKKFDTTPASREALPLKSQNGIAIIYESDSVYMMALVLEYWLMVIVGITLLLVIFSFTIYGGKILALEWFFVVSCAYFSLVGFDNQQVYSTVQALSTLKFISFNIFSIEYNESSNLWWAGFSNQFVKNCSGLIVIVSLGMIYLIVIEILSRKIQDPKSIKKFETFKRHYGTQEILITLYMITAYGLTVNFILSIFGLIKSTYSDVIGLVLGTLLLIAGVVLFMLVIKKKNQLCQYKYNFYLNSIQQYYVNFNVLVIWINSIFLVALKDTAFGNIVPILLSIGWIFFLVFLNPFKKDSERKRPIVLQVFNILVQVTFMTLKIQLTDNNQLTQASTFFLYLPFVIGLFLTFGLGHTIYCFVKKMKNAIIDRREFLENQKLFQVTKTKCANNAITVMRADSSDQQGKQEPCIDKEMALQFDKQIMQSFRKDKGFNFISHSLDYHKEDLLDKWGKLQNVQSNKTSTDVEKAKKMNKKLKRQLFLEGNKMQSYFKFSYDLEKYESAELPDKKPQDWQSGPQKDQKSKQKLQTQKEFKNSLQQKIDKKAEPNQYVTYKYETPKYNQEWMSFFKPKTISDQQKKHSLSIYDMI